MATNEFRTFVSPAEDVQANRDLLATFDGGQGMLTTPCSPDGLPPATAYISSGFVDGLDAAHPRSMAYIMVPHTMDIQEKDPYVMMEELGLQLVVEPVNG